jgi:hypothetical protein
MRLVFGAGLYHGVEGFHDGLRLIRGDGKFVSIALVMAVALWLAARCRCARSSLIQWR